MLKKTERPLRVGAPENVVLLPAMRNVAIMWRRMSWRRPFVKSLKRLTEE